MNERSRVIAVTGAGSGLGAALVRRLQEQGQTPIGVDLKGSDVDVVSVDGGLLSNLQPDPFVVRDGARGEPDA